MNILTKRVALSLATVLMAGVFMGLLGGKASASFDKGLLIGDLVFDNKNVMSAAQIDAFLNTFSKSCISTASGFQAIQPTGYSPSSGFTYGGYVSAGTVIHTAAQAYDVNPQVLLVTLEKEQSLVSGRNSTTYCSSSNNGNHKYAAATGYGCPDSGTDYSYTGLNLYRRNGTTQTKVTSTCVNTSAKAGFSQQVIRAAWLLKFSQQRSQGRVDWAIVRGNWDNSDDLSSCYSGPMVRGTWQRCPSGPSTFYDGNKTIDGQTVRMGSGATAALYWYTPHFHGNEVFVSLFEDWFGSTHGTPFFKVPNDNKTYVMGVNNKYYHVTSPDVMKAYGYGKRFFKVTTLPASELTGKTLDGALPLVARFEGDEIYLIDRSGRYHFTSEALMNEFGYFMGDEAELPTSLGLYFPDAGNMRTIIKEYEGSKIFLVDNGQRRRFLDLDAFRTGSPPYSTQPFVSLSSDFMESLDATYPILGNNKLIKTYDNGGYGYWNGEAYFNIARHTVENLRLTPDYNLHSSEIDNLPRAADPVQALAKSHGKYYVLDKKRKLEIPSADLTLYGLADADFASVSSGLTNRVATEPMSQLVGVDGSHSKYMLRDGGKDNFDSTAAINEQGFSGSELIMLSANAAAAFPSSGKLILATGTLFKVSGSPQTFLLHSSAGKLYIDSPAMMSDYGFASSSVRTLTTTQVSNYPTAATLSRFSRDGDNNVWLVHSGGKRQLVSPALAASGRFNLTVGSLNRLSSRVHQMSKNIGALKNILGDPSNNRKYYVENGNKRWITSPTAMQGLGYSNADVSMVSASFVASLPSGSNIN